MREHVMRYQANTSCRDAEMLSSVAMAGKRIFRSELSSAVKKAEKDRDKVRATPRVVLRRLHWKRNQTIT